nr:glycosyltransferase family 2 protein [Micromonospora sp. DSM 115978]
MANEAMVVEPSPRRTARHRLPTSKAWAAGASVALLVALFVVVAATTGAGATVLFAIWSAVSVLMLAVAGLTLARSQYAWQLPDRVDHVDLVDLEPPATTFSLIMPARDEPLIGRTLDRVLAVDYPPELFEILLVVSNDEVDRPTLAIAEQYAARFANVRVIAPQGSVRSKPVSLEDARRHCTGNLVGVLDAESVVAPGLLGYVNTLAVRQVGVGIFQGGVQLMNYRAHGWSPPPGAGRVKTALSWLNSGTSWWRVRNCLEYYIWFMSRLRYQAATQFIPLGGNTVFVRASVLDELGGWDVNCLTEDC